MWSAKRLNIYTLGSNQQPRDSWSRALQTEIMVKFIVDTQVHHIVYVACVGSHNHWKKDCAPNYLSWLIHMIINDEVRGLTL